MDIDMNELNGFLDEASGIVKGSMGCTEKCKPLCSIRFEDGNDGIEFDLELRGILGEEEAFSLIGKLDSDTDRYFSRGLFTPHGGHCTSYALSHDEPRGMSLQQGIFIEMKNILSRISENRKSEFVESLLGQLDGMKVKVQVVKSDGDVLDAVDKAGLDEFKSENGVSDEPIGRLEIKSDKGLEQQQQDAAQTPKTVEAPEDTVGEEFARAVGDREEKPDEDNPIDSALENSQVYIIKKKSIFRRFVEWLRGLLGMDADRKKLGKVFNETFCPEDKEGK